MLKPLFQLTACCSPSQQWDLALDTGNQLGPAGQDTELLQQILPPCAGAVLGAEQGTLQHPQQTAEPIQQLY